MHVTLLSLGWMGFALLGALFATYLYLDRPEPASRGWRIASSVVVALFALVLAVECMVLYYAALTVAPY